MAKDRLLELTALGDNTFLTKTASFTGPVNVEINQVQTSQVLHVRIVVKKASVASGTANVAFNLMESADGTNFTPLTSTQIVLGTTPLDDVYDLPFNTKKKFVRLDMAMSGGTTPTITYSAGVACTGN